VAIGRPSTASVNGLPAGVPSGSGNTASSGRRAARVAAGAADRRRVRQSRAPARPPGTRRHCRSRPSSP
jgi:hypothetical protein